MSRRYTLSELDAMRTRVGNDLWDSPAYQKPWRPEVWAGLIEDRLRTEIQAGVDPPEQNCR